MNSQLVELSEMVYMNVRKDIPDNMEIDKEWVHECLQIHAQQYPGSWQNWTMKGKLRSMTAMIRQALRKKEYYPTRIVSFFG